ncbi:hypothetical protein BAUCODRAFT_540989 [Baudoinia panamericana UAMH 10762]|uniref:Uncharacterized protein n=1 Tax=Baudoinia panamericana (strain UAMH 10762) TaxID=717646 RepID=M2MFI7_BAUPA|nr:uncharacterized protein BAUCODRAFT_540989 [Baudoinia panamericana UAMH 10762]EMC95416.1 hypothetical protein BAUCODRAFT_540989 [Baudoinia panamericana UAMH 10762]
MVSESSQASQTTSHSEWSKTEPTASQAKHTMAFANSPHSARPLRIEGEKCNSSTFLPNYETAVNENLRSFDHPEAPASKYTASDGVASPGTRWWTGMSRRNLVVISMLATVLVTVIAIITSLLVNRLHQPQKTHTPSRSANVVTLTATVTDVEVKSVPSLPSHTQTWNPTITVTVTATQVLASTFVTSTKSMLPTPSSLVTSYTTMIANSQSSSGSEMTSIPASVLSAEASISAVLASIAAHQVAPLTMLDASTRSVPPQQTTMAIMPVVTASFTTLIVPNDPVNPSVVTKVQAFDELTAYRY